MDKEKIIQDEVERTLTAFHDLPRLQPDPFLLTRLQAAWTSEQPHEHKFSWNIVQVRTIILTVVVILNIIMAFFVFRSEKSQIEREMLISAISREYQIDQNTITWENIHGSDSSK